MLLNTGEFSNFLSYAYAPASVVAPHGTVGTAMLMHEDGRLTVDFPVCSHRELYIRATNFR